MCPEIGYHVVEVRKVSCRQVDGVAFLGAIIVTTPFSEVAPYAGVWDGGRSCALVAHVLGVQGAGYLQPRE